MLSFRHNADPYSSLPQIISGGNHSSNSCFLQSRHEEEKESSIHKSLKQLNVQDSNISTGYESLPYIFLDNQQMKVPVPTKFQELPFNSSINRMSSTLPRPPKKKLSLNTKENDRVSWVETSVVQPSARSLFQNPAYIETDVKLSMGRNSIMQSPCFNDTYHDDTYVSRTLPRPAKKLPRGHRTWVTEIKKIQDINVSLINMNFYRN